MKDDDPLEAVGPSSATGDSKGPNEADIDAIGNQNVQKALQNERRVQHDKGSTLNLILASLQNQINTFDLNVLWLAVKSGSHFPVQKRRLIS